MTASPHLRRLAAALHVVALLLLGLHIYVRTLPATPDAIPTSTDAEAAWWGLWPVTYLPAWLFWLGVTLWLSFMVALWRRELRAHRRPTAPLPYASLVLFSVLLAFSFYLFPIVHTRWGDAYILSRAIAWPDAALRLTHSWQAPLDVHLHSLVWHWFHLPLNWGNDAIPVYHLLSPVAGMIFLVGVLALARNRALAPAWLTYGLLVSLGLLQLFYGYIENYSFAAAGILLYLWLGLEALAGRRPLWQAALALAITNATHPSTIVLAPSLLYCGWAIARDACTKPCAQGKESTDKRNLLVRLFVLHSALPMGLVAAATIALMEWGGHGIEALLTHDRPGGSDASWFVPLFDASGRWQHYTLFSWLHVRDLLNEQLLVAPVVLPSLLVLWLWSRIPAVSTATGAISGSGAYANDGYRREGVVHAENEMEPKGGLFLLTAALFHMALIWVWNPDYGGQRDWDLFSLALLPLTLLLAYWLPRFLGRGWYCWFAAAPLVLLQALHTAAWVYQNTLPWEWP
jgi:hypothetical protein